MLMYKKIKINFTPSKKVLESAISRSGVDLTPVFISIGTNKGNKEQNILNALKFLDNEICIEIVQISHMYINPPQEGVSGDDFLNGVIKIHTTLSPTKLLKILNNIESELGRKSGEKGKHKARIIDLDILLFGNQKIKTVELTIPHPKMKDRDFVMIPLKEVTNTY